MSGWRSFIAIELPSALQQALRPALESLSRISAVRSSAPSGIHLTLHFLGNVEPGVLDELAERAAPLVAGVPAFELALAGVGAFPSPRRPQVFYAGVEQPEGTPLLALHGTIRPLIAELGLPLDARDYRPHLTLGRTRRPLNRADSRLVEAWHRDWAAHQFGRLPVHEIALLRSELGAGPPRYTTLRRFHLEEETAARRI